MLLWLLGAVALAAGAPPLAGYGPAEMDAYVRALSRSGPRFEARLERVIRDSVGTPYFDGPLGEGPTGIFDRDPLVDFTRVDCVTSVEQWIDLTPIAAGRPKVQVRCGSAKTSRPRA